MTDHHGELTTNLVFDNRLASYGMFLDDAWSERFVTESDKSRLRESAFILLRDWRGTAHAFRTAWLTVHSLKWLQDDLAKQTPGFFNRFSTAFGKYVAERSKLSNMRRRELIGAVKQLGETVARSTREHPPDFDAEVAWRGFLENPQFVLSLWSTQRMSFSALFFAYENFLQRAVAVARRDDEYRALRVVVLAEDFAEVFGADLGYDCFDHPDVGVARLVRNCLSHDGGRESKKLRDTQHRIRVENGDLQVFPEDVRGLFDLLKARSMRVVERAAQLPVFR
jgi:hypothetical protein